tara:strand:- start:590 stop:1147 length:558 start_codon:yes stop_codon:yes gene_type:complete
MALISSKYRPNITLDVQEFKEFEKKLKAFEGMTVKKRRNKMKSVLTYALRNVKKDMIANATRIKRRGVLANSIETVDQKAVGFGSRIGKRTGPRIRGTSSKRAYHAHLVELGTKRKLKTVKPGNQPFRFYSFKNRRWVFTKRIMHGSKAQPFIKPAYEKNKKDIPDRIKTKMQTILKNEYKRHGV